MFPTSGYFRSFPCPFYATGFCERPNCHYRHVKSVSAASPGVANEAVSTWSGSADEDSGGAEKPYLLRLVREAVLQVQKEVEADKLKLHSSEDSPEQNDDDKDESLDSAAAKATDDDIEIRDNLLDDVELLIPSKSGVRASTKKQKAPVYTPTPIAKLKILQMKQQLQQQKPPKETVPKATSSNVLEYDPTESCPNTKKPEMAIDYKPSPKVKCTTKASPKNKEPKSKSWPDSVKSGGGGVASSSSFSAEPEESDLIGDSDDDHSADLPPTFSDDDETNVPADKLTTNVETTKEEDVHSNFDVVNRILSESKFCSSMISAASLKRDKQTKLAAKTESNKASVSKKHDKVGSSADKPKSSSSSKTSKGKPSKSTSKSTLEMVDSATKSNKESGPAKKKEKTVDIKKGSSTQQGNSKKSSVTKSSSSKTVSTKVVDAKQRHNKDGNKISTDIQKKKLSSPVKHNESSAKLTEQCNGDSASKNNNPSAVPVVNTLSTSVVSLPESLSIDSDEDLDEHDTYEECLRIFNEYVPQHSENTVSKRAEHKVEEESDYTQTAGKKRIAHDGGATQTVKRPKYASLHQPHPSSIMQNRLIQSLQNYKENQGVSQSPVDSSGTKRRIAHTPCYQPSAPKQTMISSFAGPSTSQISKPTLAQTAVKGTVRVAHIPTQTTLKRPMIPAEFGCRVPINIRQRYLNMIIDECLAIYNAEQDAFDRAVNEEKSSYDRSSNRTIYLNSVAITIKKLRSEKSGQLPPPPPNPSVINKATTFGKRPVAPLMRPPPQRLLSHEAILNGKKGANLPIGIQKKKLKPYEEPITGSKLYFALRAYVLTKEQLDTNGYPMIDPNDPSRAVIHKQDKKSFKSANPLEKICARCGSPFEVSPNGIYITKSECFYHWGRVYKKRIAGSIEGKYSCCGERAHSPGCCVADLHVFEDLDTDNLRGFVKTLPKSPPMNGDCGTFALDCEMSYTNRGMELVRVTVIGADLKPVYETLVKPENPVIDYNTRFSGITKEDLDGVVTSIRDVQAVLLSMFSHQTILVGHSLESDLKALKLIHGTVVDTSVVFPHRLGAPYKRALRNLTAELLGKFIQNDVHGHDSQEDAAACMELMLYKLKEDMKKLC